MKALLLILQYLPVVLAGIKAVEEQIGAGQGKAKKDIILNAITAAAQGGEQIPQPTVAILSAFIDLTVATLNASGVFGKSKPLPA